MIRECIMRLNIHTPIYRIFNTIDDKINGKP